MLPIAQGAAFRNAYGRMPTNASPGDRMFAEYFRQQTHRLRESCLAEIRTPEDWRSAQPRMRAELFEMLGLNPLPPRTELKATVTGVLTEPDFTVEKLHFQSMPGLYVTANLYLPRATAQPVPAILYACGHGLVKSNGVSYGNKVHYQHHGIWFARHGYACLVLDTVQMGELEGIHHGTAREGMWWWNSRGYSSAAVEAWNGIRALDYLETRPEVDRTRIGATGRSGGGAYSWWVAALDERIAAVCPVAGITDLENYVVDGVVEGHCDCMFPVNTYRWDFAQIAALVAPRPLLIANTDKDTIFPLDGVQRLHEQVRRIYELNGASDRLGLLITEGPHQDTQDLQIPVLRWFDRFLRKEPRLIELAASPRFRPEQLKVFDRLPEDEITRRCHERFTQLASDSTPFNSVAALTELRKKTFGGWPEGSAAPMPRRLASQERDGVSLSVYEFESQPAVSLRMYVIAPTHGPVKSISLRVVDEPAWRDQLRVGRVGFASALKAECELASIDSEKGPVNDAETREFNGLMSAFRQNETCYVTLTPRGVGMTRSGGDQKHQTLIRRRFMLLGQTLAGMQVWDARRAVQTLQSMAGYAELPVHVVGESEMTEVVAFAALFEPKITSVSLPHPVRRDLDAPDFLNWSRIVTPSQLMLMLEQRCPVTIEGGK